MSTFEIDEHLQANTVGVLPSRREAGRLAVPKPSHEAIIKPSLYAEEGGDELQHAHPL
jgi:hypothetical protein